MNPFRIQYNGITIETGTHYTINELSGLDDLDIRTSSDVLTGGDGGNVWAQNYGMRKVSFQGTIIADNSTDFFTYKDAFLLAFQKTDTAQALIIRMWNGVEKILYAKVLVMPQIIYKGGQANYCRYRVTLICEDPLYSNTVDNIYTTGLIQDAGGAIPTAIPMSLSAGVGGTVVVPNNGDLEAYATFEIKGPCLNPVVQDSTLGTQFQIVKQILAGEVVTIQKTTQGLTVTSSLNGNYFQYFTGGFFKLALGNNTIKFSASSYDASALLTIRFSDKTLTPS